MINETEKRGRGRPRKVENGYGSDCHIRLSDKEVSMLSTLNSDLGIESSEALREGLKLFYLFKTLKGVD